MKNDKNRAPMGMRRVRRAAPALLMLSLALLAACTQRAAGPQWSGYAEGEPIYLAAAVAGRLAELKVRAGDSVAQDQALFALDGELERAADAEAQARARNAAAVAANTDKGRRREELAVIEAQTRQARSAAELARSELERQQQLLAQGFVARARVDDATLQLKQAQARVNELEAALASARLPAREDERSAARALSEAAGLSRAQVDWRLRQTQQKAPAAGRVVDTFYKPGEWVAAGQPVLALLPPAARKARFYVPEAELGALRAQQAVQISCDGCGAPIPAHISYIAPQAEYTPPVIYSNQQRAKLVFLVEALPDKPADAERLHPGQPLDVQP